MQKLSDSEINAKLEEYSNWNYNGKDIWKEYKFNNYLDSIEFVQKIGLKAETIDHHPRMIVDYKKVIIEIHTHTVNGITKLDFKLAGMIEAVLHKI
ncbi:MAG: 4a-hydroxytetrahydrobiopterin dehydratase [Spirochaetota bacterium]